MLSATSPNFDQCKTLSSGNGLKLSKTVLFILIISGMQANHLSINFFKAHLIVTDMSPHPTFAWSGHSSLYFLLSPLAVSET